VLRSLPGTEAKVAKGITEALADVEKVVGLKNDEHRFTAMPDEGWDAERVLAYMRQLRDIEEAKWRPGKVSGVIYSGGTRRVPK